MKRGAQTRPAPPFEARQTLGPPRATESYLTRQKVSKSVQKRADTLAVSQNIVPQDIYEVLDLINTVPEFI